MQPLFFLTMVTIKDGVSLRRLHCPFTYNPTYVPSLITTALGALLTSPAAVHVMSSPVTQSTVNPASVNTEIRTSHN